MTRYRVIPRLVVKIGCQDWLSRLVVKIVVIASTSASSESVFGIFSSATQMFVEFYTHLWVQATLLGSRRKAQFVWIYEPIYP